MNAEGNTQDEQVAAHTKQSSSCSARPWWLVPIRRATPPIVQPLLRSLTPCAPYADRGTCTDNDPINASITNGLQYCNWSVGAWRSAPAGPACLRRHSDPCAHVFHPPRLRGPRGPLRPPRVPPELLKPGAQAGTAVCVNFPDSGADSQRSSSRGAADQALRSAGPPLDENYTNR